MKRVFTTLLLALVLAGFNVFSVLAEVNWTVLTEELPPYHYTSDGSVRGAATDILLEMVREKGLEIKREDIQSLPWPRAYQLALDTPGAILYSMARTKDREPLFEWVGPITDITTGLIGLKKSNIQILTTDDLKKHKIGTIRDSAAEHLLQQVGVPVVQLDRIVCAKSNIRKLESGRIDLFAYNVLGARFVMKQLGMNPENYETVYTFKSQPLYFAFHKDTDKQLIDELNTTLQEMKKPDSTGGSTVLRILNSYFD